MPAPIISPDLLMARGAALKEVQKGEIIFREGTHCCFYYQVMSGQVRWVNINDEGREFLQSIILSGECFGEIPLFDDGPYVSTAIADQDTTLLRLGKSAFLELIKEDPELHLRFTSLMAERLRFKFMVVKEMASYSPEHCITTLLYYFRDKHKFTSENEHKVTLTRQQIADMTGLRVETVIRAIRHLHEKGQLVIERGKVYC
ncbi:MAG: Crp/Fnr family transcriptional regulator [Chitinophagaceae bacterium]